MVSRIVCSCGRCDSSTTITAKTIEARPRGPNQPRKPTVGGRAGAEHRERDREHAHHGEAEHRVERQVPAHVAERGPEQDGAEEQERDAVEQAAELLDRGG